MPDLADITASIENSPQHYLEGAVTASGQTQRPPVTGVAVTAAGIHAALVELGLITA